MKKKKTKRIFLRVTEDELTQIKKRASRFQSLTQFVFSAIRAFEDYTLSEKLEAERRLADYYTKADEKLAHIGGNLNQAMKRVNEASKIGSPTQALILNGLMPEIRQCLEVCQQLRKEILRETSDTVK